MRKIILVAALALAATPALAEDASQPKTFVLTEAQAADYINRLSIEMRQIQAQFEADRATVESLSKQAKPADDQK